MIYNRRYSLDWEKDSSNFYFKDIVIDSEYITLFIAKSNKYYKLYCATYSDLISIYDDILYKEKFETVEEAMQFADKLIEKLIKLKGFL